MNVSIETLQHHMSQESRCSYRHSVVLPPKSINKILNIDLDLISAIFVGKGMAHLQERN